jgi:transglutaminase-like putative cysteine protease
MKGRIPAVQHGHRVEIHPYPGEPSERTLQIDLEPITPPVVFLPPEAISITLLGRGEPLLGRPTPLFAGPEGEFKYTGDERGLRYEVSFPGSTPRPPEKLSNLDRQRYLSVPSSTTTRTADLAKRWTAGAKSPAQRASAIERHLRAEYQYDLESPSGAAKNPLDHFLFESHRGHCEFYSTAMAVLLRTVDVPTRNVTGFIGGTFNRFGRFYAVRQGDAHSWTEVYIDGVGWHRYDPTPPTSAVPQAEIQGVLAFLRDVVEAAAQRWNRHVIGYDLDQQVRLLRNVSRRYANVTGRSSLSSTLSGRRLAMLALGIAILAASAYVWRRRRKGPAGKPGEAATRPQALQVVALYRALETALAARAAPRPPGTPPLAHARGLVALDHPIAAEVMELTELYLEARFGGRELSDADRRDFQRRVKLLRQAPSTEARVAA